MERIFKKKILAIKPIYLKNIGNSSQIYTKENGQIEIHKTVKTVTRNLAKYYHLDLKEVRKTYGELLSQKKFPPLPFTARKIFISVKTRKPRLIHDGAYGYIRLNAIDRLARKEGKTLIYLNNGDKISSLSSLDTVRKRVNKGRIVEKLLGSQNNLRIRESQDFYLKRDSLATKEDIALLYMKMSELQEVIK